MKDVNQHLVVLANSMTFCL